MIDIDEVEFVKILTAMAAMKKFDLTKPVIDLWWLTMSDWSIADFRQAAAHLLKTSKWMPGPNDFDDLRKAGEETAGEIFGGLKQWFRYTPNGYVLREGTPHAIAASIRAIGGPDAYMLGDVSKLPFLEKRFCQHYEQISGKEETRLALPGVTNNAQIEYSDESE